MRDGIVRRCGGEEGNGEGSGILYKLLVFV